MKEVEIEKTKYCRGQNLAIGLSKYRKIKALSPLNFQEKYDYILLYFGYFLPKRGAWSHVEGSESKFDLPYCSLPGHVSMQKVLCQHFPVLRL